MNTQETQNLFRLWDVKWTEEAANSIYRYSPVYKCQYRGQDVIIKRTRRTMDTAQKLVEWTTSLHSNGIKVVTPVKVENPFIQYKDHTWTMYPFIKGRKYDGSLQDIYEAGRLLGQIHNKVDTFECARFDWLNFDDEFTNDVTNDLQEISSNLLKNRPEKKEFNILKGRIEDFLTSDFSRLKKKTLPMVNASWDYKASNLVYEKDNHPVLIDPDNGGIVPRIVDLALALILFHTEIETAPSRLFTEEEWTEFTKGYFEYITLTEEEKILWQDVLLFVYFDEALWAIVDMEDDETERQKKFIYSLTAFNPVKYSL
ncbi:phosphotransferase [Bacillus sp. SCS-151]|uniref:phosphotransferase n=1 Tax=Nanhaiella sioensis TaxID=3115293 RepID=UPI00397B40C9